MFDRLILGKVKETLAMSQGDYVEERSTDPIRIVDRAQFLLYSHDDCSVHVTIVMRLLSN